MRPPRRLGRWVAAGSLLVACADIAEPSRGNAYEWRRIVTTATGVDTLSFHWDASDLPVRFWVENSLNLPAHVQQGIEQWEAVFLYGEFSGTLVSDSSAADVIVRVGIAPKGGFSITRLARGMAPECQGATDVELSVTGNQILRPIRIYVDPRFAPGSPGIDECMALTTTHEIGHALGIFTHSPNPDDFMYADPVVSTISRRDRSTAELAYHTPPTLSIEPR
jgi:predicted Zn-dependent protease